VLYPKIIRKFDLEVLLITEYLDRLIKESKLKLDRKINMRVSDSFTIR
jgi:Fe-S oxidoreductase